MKKLSEATSRIINLEQSTIKNMNAIANTLKEVKIRKLYKQGGYKDVHEYANAELGYKKSTTYALIQVAERFLTDNNTSKLQTEIGKDYSISQLRELASLSDTKVKELINHEIITPDKSVRDIKEIVKEYKPKKKIQESKSQIENNNYVEIMSNANELKENDTMNTEDTGATVIEAQEYTNLPEEPTSGLTEQMDVESVTLNKSELNSIIYNVLFSVSKLKELSSQCPDIRNELLSLCEDISNEMQIQSNWIN